MALVLTEVNNTKLYQTDFWFLHLNEAIAHHVCSRVKAQNNFFFYNFSHGMKVGSVQKL